MDGTAGSVVALFAYGTLRTPAVQLGTFGRLIVGDDDVLPGYRMTQLEITDPRVIELSGRSTHPTLRHTGDPLDKVIGRVLQITDDELDAADEYEAATHRRARVTLASGLSAWVYLSP